jgi:arylsulfatase
VDKLFLKSAGLLASSAMLGSLAPADVQAQETEKPNVVIMLADNLGYGDVGSYGAGEIRGMLL